MILPDREFKPCPERLWQARIRFAAVCAVFGLLIVLLPILMGVRAIPAVLVVMVLATGTLLAVSQLLKMRYTAVKAGMAGGDRVYVTEWYGRQWSFAPTRYTMTKNPSGLVGRLIPNDTYLLRSGRHSVFVHIPGDPYPEAILLERELNTMTHNANFIDCGDYYTARLEGMQVTRCEFDYSVGLLLYRDKPDHSYGHINIWNDFTLTRAGITQHLRLPDEEDPNALGIVVSLFLKTLESVKAYKDGTLELRFDDGAVVTVGPDPNYESWTMNLPCKSLIIGNPGGGVVCV